MRTSTTGLTESAELIEAEAMYRHLTDAPAVTRDDFGMAAARVGGGVVLSARLDPYDLWNKALGLGFAEPVTRDLIDKVISFYREQHTPTAVIQIAPSVLPPDWHEICATRGLQDDGSSLKLAGPIADVRADAPTDLRVGQVDRADAHEWATVVARAFDIDDPALGAMLTAMVHHPAARTFAVWDDDEIVAGASLFLHGTTARLNSGATLPSHRRRGAQSALIAARLEAALSAGAEWVVAETGTPAHGEINQSLVNLQRAGLQVVHERQNWRWRA